MSDPNVFEPEWEQGTPPGAARRRVAAAAGRAGARRDRSTSSRRTPRVSPYHVHHAQRGADGRALRPAAAAHARGRAGARAGRRRRVPARPGRRPPGRRTPATSPSRVLLVSTMNFPESPSTGHRTLLMMTAPGAGQGVPGRRRATGVRALPRGDGARREHLVVAERPRAGSSRRCSRPARSSRTAARAGSAPGCADSGCVQRTITLRPRQRGDDLALLLGLGLQQHVAPQDVRPAREVVQERVGERHQVERARRDVDRLARRHAAAGRVLERGMSRAPRRAGRARSYSGARSGGRNSAEARFAAPTRISSVSTAAPTELRADRAPPAPP